MTNRVDVTTQPGKPLTRADANEREGTAVTSKRRTWHTAERSTVWLPAQSMAEALAEGERLGVRRVFVCGQPETPGVALRSAPPGARVYADGHYPAMSRAGTSVTCAAQWWGPQVPPRDAERLWNELSDAIRALWHDRRIELLSNPASAGLDLWARSIRGEAWPVLPESVAPAVRASAGQGRLELYPARTTKLVELYEYDQRFAYAALVRRLPVGMPSGVSDMSGPYAAGRYVVDATAPPGWKGPGLIGSRDDAGGWTWPLEVAGQWASGEEITLARKHYWIVHVRAGMEWQQRGEPLRSWAGRLVEIHRTGGPALAGAARSLLLHTIGALHGAPRRITATGAEPPADALGVRTLASGGYAWHEQLPPRHPELVHPEWTTTVWSRARARIIDSNDFGLAHVNPAQLVAARTDALITAGPIHVPSDSGKPGAWRLKSVSAPMKWPETSAALLARKVVR